LLADSFLADSLLADLLLTESTTKLSLPVEERRFSAA
jgi:hypothetical protein